MADQYTIGARPNTHQLQTNVLLDWQCILDQLLDQSSIWEMEDLGGGSGGPKEPELVVDTIQVSPNNF